jgi:hypothetical protein
MFILKKILLSVLIASVIIAVPLALSNSGEKEVAGPTFTTYSEKVGG